MIHSEKLRNKLIESTHQPPHENVLLLDLPGEVWKPFPVAPFDEHYEVSNKGRVKRNAHTIINAVGIPLTLNEQIIKPRVVCFYNHYLKEKVYHSVCRVTFDRRRSSFRLSRLIYHAFVAPFDFYDQDIYVRHKDGNGLNCLPENLYLFERRKLTKWLLDHGRKSLLSGASDRLNYSKEEIEKWNAINERVVSQYDLKGRFVRIFKSRMEAAKAVGIHPTSISAVIKGKVPTAGDFLWREGVNPAKQIDVPHIMRRVKVAKYNLRGELTAVFPTIAEAARNVQLSKDVVADRIYGRSRHRRFILKAIDEYSIPPEKITVELPPEIDSDYKKDGIPEGRNYPFQYISLNNLPGEKWEEIPGTDSLYWLSNMGRVKSTDHKVHTLHGCYMKYGQIIRQSIASIRNTDQLVLRANFMVKGKASNRTISNLVYKIFIGAIPSKYAVVHKDNDIFNCRAENLQLRSLSDIRKEYFRQGRLSHDRFNKPIAQYTLDGKLIATYPSINDVVDQTGFNRCKISACINSKIEKYKGYIWRHVPQGEEAPETVNVKEE